MKKKRLFEVSLRYVVTELDCLRMKNLQSETKVTFKKEMINFYGKPAIIRLLLRAYLHTTTITMAIKLLQCYSTFTNYKTFFAKLPIGVNYRVLLNQFFGLVNFVIKWRYSRKLLQSKSLITWAPKDSKVFGNTK